MGKSGFKELMVWQKSKSLAVAIYKVTDTGKIARDQGLTEQLRRCAVSVPSNIAEGDERSSDKDSIRFFFMAKGSLAELITQLEIACEVGHLTSEQITPLTAQAEELARRLGALIRSRQSPLAPRPSPR